MSGIFYFDCYESWYEMWDPQMYPFMVSNLSICLIYDWPLLIMDITNFIV